MLYIYIHTYIYAHTYVLTYMHRLKWLSFPRCISNQTMARILQSYENILCECLLCHNSPNFRFSGPHLFAAESHLRAVNVCSHLNDLLEDHCTISLTTVRPDLRSIFFLSLFLCFILTALPLFHSLVFQFFIAFKFTGIAKQSEEKYCA